MLQALRLYGLMVFLAALFITPALQIWVTKPVAVLLAILPLALLTSWQYRQARCSREDWQAVRQHHDLWLTVMGKAVLWGILLVLLAIYPAHELLALVAIGLLIGMQIAQHLSRTHIETGLIPVGALGVMGCIIVLGWQPAQPLPLPCY